MFDEPGPLGQRVIDSQDASVLPFDGSRGASLPGLGLVRVAQSLKRSRHYKLRFQT